MAMLQILKDNKVLKKKNMFPMGFMREAVLSKFPVLTETFYEQKQLDLFTIYLNLKEDEKNCAEKLVEVRTEIKKNEDDLENVKWKRHMFEVICDFKCDQYYNYFVTIVKDIYDKIGGDYFERFLAEEILNYMEKEKYKNFIYAGSFCDVLSGDLKVSKDIDIFTTNNHLDRILRQLIRYPVVNCSAFYLTQSDGSSISQHIPFMSYKFGGLNIVVYNSIRYEQPDNQMLANFTLSNFNHAVTKHSLIFYEDLNSFLLTEHSVVGKISKLIDIASDEVAENIKTMDSSNPRLCKFFDYIKRKNPYPYKHFHNVVDGMVKPNTLLALCSHYIQENLLGVRIKGLGFMGPDWKDVNTCCLKYLVEHF